jgi:hypothetical protein
MIATQLFICNITKEKMEDQHEQFNIEGRLWYSVIIIVLRLDTEGMGTA